MEKLELKHVAPYLPYGLKCNILNYKCDYVGIEKSTIKGYYFIGETLHLTYNGGSTGKVNENEIEIYLRPLSDLTKEIEIDGDKFIPLRKLHEYQETNFFYGDEKPHLKGYPFVDNIISIKHNKYGYDLGEDFMLKYSVETSNMGTLVHSFTYSPDLRRFLLRDDTRSKPLGVGHQLDMFDLLHEWHFDTRGLIEKGLAIDINILEK